MEISAAGQSEHNAYALKIQGQAAYAANTRQPEGSEEAALSTAASLAYQRQLTEVQISGQETILGYRKDQSLAMRAVSRVDVTSRVERISIDLTFSAEILGLSQADFAVTNGQPIQFKLSLSTFDQTIQASQSSKTVQTTRSLDEILRDVGKKLTQALRGDNDEKILLKLDAEALRALMGDEQASEFFQTMMSLIAFINHMRAQAGSDEWQEIEISGKGKPYIDIQQNVTIDQHSQVIDFQMTILPPDGTPGKPETALAGELPETNLPEA